MANESLGELDIFEICRQNRSEEYRGQTTFPLRVRITNTSGKTKCITKNSFPELEGYRQCRKPLRLVVVLFAELELLENTALVAEFVATFQFNSEFYIFCQQQQFFSLRIPFSFLVALQLGRGSITVGD